MQFCPRLQQILNSIINKLNISFHAVYSEVNKIQVFALKYFNNEILKYFAIK